MAIGKLEPPVDFKNMPSGFTKTPSRRQRKISAFLRQQISEVIRAGNFFGLTGLITISLVETTPDLREAKVWFTCLNQDPEEALRILNKEIYEIQGELYNNATIRKVPKIRFVIDKSQEYNEHINKVFRDLKDE